MEGKFITLEGIEGSGKSTSLETISKKLTQEKIDFVVTKEPGGGPLGPPLRNLLLNKDAKISPQVELLLMMADRKNHLEEIILPNIKKGIWVVSDRYLDSTYAYQGGGRLLDISQIDKISKILDLKDPDLTILFDISPEVSLERAKKRSDLDRFESEPIDFHKRIRETYLTLAERYNSRYAVVNSSLGFEEVELEVNKVIDNFIK